MLYDFRVDADSSTGELDFYLIDEFVFTHTVQSILRNGLSGLVGGNEGAYFDNFVVTSIECTDGDGDGYYLESGCPEPLDCNETNENIYPTNSNTYCDCEGEIQEGITEYCTGGIDEDCDGLVDEADPDCNTAPCSGPAASTVGVSPVYSVSALGKQMAYFMLPLGAMIGLMIWRRKR